MSTSTEPAVNAAPSPAFRPLPDWRLYAAAAGAALAAGSNADASIIYSGPLNIDLKLPGAPAQSGTIVSKTFMIGSEKETALLSRRGFTRTIITYADLGKAFQTTSSANAPQALRFNRGGAINGSVEGLAILREQLHIGTHLFQPGGYFAPGQVGYAGLRLNDGDYGWLQVEVLSQNNNGYPDELKVLGWAYENVANRPINAGQTVETVPEPGSKALALLALGSAGVLAWRKRRTVPTAP
jgi:hypothetical protein